MFQLLEVLTRTLLLLLLLHVHIVFIAAVRTQQQQYVAAASSRCKPTEVLPAGRRYDTSGLDVRMALYSLVAVVLYVHVHIIRIQYALI